MKKILIALILTQLSGCALWDIYNMSHFDNNEYKLINDIRTLANLDAAKCGKPEVVPLIDELYAITVSFKNYGEYIPHNEETHKAAVELEAIVKDFRDRYRKP